MMCYDGEFGIYSSNTGINIWNGSNFEVRNQVFIVEIVYVTCSIVDKYNYVYL